MARILIVDDSSFQRANLRIMLRQAGFESVEAASAQEALELLKTEKLDGMIVDLIMPDMGGTELLQALKEKGIALPVIVMTADIQDVVREECLELGAVAVLHKPPKKEDLTETLSQALAAS